MIDLERIHGMLSEEPFAAAVLRRAIDSAKAQESNPNGQILIMLFGMAMALGEVHRRAKQSGLTDDDQVLPDAPEDDGARLQEIPEERIRIIAARCTPEAVKGLNDDIRFGFTRTMIRNLEGLANNLGSGAAAWALEFINTVTDEK